MSEALCGMPTRLKCSHFSDLAGYTSGRHPDVTNGATPPKRAFNSPSSVLGTRRGAPRARECDCYAMLPHAVPGGEGVDRASSRRCFGRPCGTLTSTAGGRIACVCTMLLQQSRRLSGRGGTSAFAFLVCTGQCITSHTLLACLRFHGVRGARWLQEAGRLASEEVLRLLLDIRGFRAPHAWCHSAA